MYALQQLGFGVVGFACTTCNGMSGALDPLIQHAIMARHVHTVAVLSEPQPSDGRIHPDATQAFGFAASGDCLCNRLCTIRFDIERDVLGHDADGTPVMLKDIWPSDADIDALVRRSVHPEQFRRVYMPLLQASRQWRECVPPLYAWHPQSTYIRRPPLLGRRLSQCAHLARVTAVGGAGR